MVSHNKTIHSLVIPLSGLSLLIPSSIIVEVVNVPEIIPIPFSENWSQGVIAWRQRAVPLLAFETLIGGEVIAPDIRTNVVVLFPLTGRKEWDFFGILTIAEPHPYHVGDEEKLMASPTESEYISGAIQIDDEQVCIPDIDRLQAALYPK